MPDFSRFLPLSQRANIDETGVSNDWRPFVAQRLDHLLASRMHWDAAALGGGSNGSVLTALAARLSSTRRHRLAVRLGAGNDPTASDPEAVIDLLSSISRERASGTGPRGVGELVAVVAAELAVRDTSADPPVHLDLPARVSGAVALHLTLAAPLPIRAAIRDRTLVATDAGWRFGNGAPLEAPAEELLAFLCGLAPVPS